MAAYIALLRKEPGSDYGVDFPDFPSCITAGRDLDEARRMAAEALAFHIEGLTEDAAEIPAPSSLDEIIADLRNKDAIGFLVEVRARPVEWFAQRHSAGGFGGSDRPRHDQSLPIARRPLGKARPKRATGGTDLTNCSELGVGSGPSECRMEEPDAARAPHSPGP